ncbi:hypothetical protein C8F01DRAFT_996937 [Mycena amicta]|nr:hypothetical protein C8F01DRAFT_996937 [Mycena amicta]
MEGLPTELTGDALLDAFRRHYRRFEEFVQSLATNPTDAIVISRLGDDLNEFVVILREVYESHHGHPTIVQTVEAIGPGRPRIHIDPEFLRWAYTQRSTSSIARYLGLGRSTVRNALLEYGIVQPRSNPFPSTASPPAEDSDNHPPDNTQPDDLLEPDLALPEHLPDDLEGLANPDPGPSATSFTGPLSDMTDDDLDLLLLRLRIHYRRAGIRMLHGMLLRLGHRVPHERIRQSLLRIDPVRRIFERIRIRRREYRVLGPNSLWHHDGQHGMSVHNVRIERLWVDVTAQVGATWGDHFTLLELRHGLNINNVAHIWLLHFLFLATINSQLAFFAESWNNHRIQIRNGPNRSPIDMFGFDMYVCGVRGDELPAAEEDLSEEELEVFGIDWQGLRDDAILESQRQNNPLDENSTSWLGRTGPPTDLSHVAVDPPIGTLTEEEVERLVEMAAPLMGSAENEDITALWSQALATVRSWYPDVF